LEVDQAVPAELSGGSLDLEDVLARLPHLTVHLVELPDRWWVADPATLTCWVHKDAGRDQRRGWVREAGIAIVRARPDLTTGGGGIPPRGARLHSVPR
jgi:hypothetical protein